jgi:hypothetical protein
VIRVRSVRGTITACAANCGVRKMWSMRMNGRMELKVRNIR